MLKIPNEIYDSIIAHAQEGFPLEVCGILGGREGIVSAIYRMTNTDQSNEHFMMEPKEQFAVVSYAIVSLVDREKPVLKSFRIEAGIVIPEEIQLSA